MASVFTFDPDPPRVSSPWSVSARQSPRPDHDARSIEKSRAALSEDFEELQLPQSDDLHVTRLDAEPQEGPTEYKLHLLLRPRRSLSATTTARNVSGSHQPHSPAASPRSQARLGVAYTPPLSSSAGSRQHRLEQLTTQLLWRLQQSSPHHSSSATNVILPSIPDASIVHGAPPPPPPLGKLVPGLEESKGALYEIGVSDDGTFVGLTRDEMSESLNNLGAMAASLGCSVQVLRMVPVGECEWQDASRLRRGRLYVAEAYIRPELRIAGAATVDAPADANAALRDSWAEPAAHHVSSEQLRVSITGATTSGKSTLLGTLSTSTLDNSRGKSRLSLLKHRHEIVSGMTSSVAQELIGYRDMADSSQIQVINYGTKDIASWNDIHAASSDAGRLAFLSDSAGHPRYRRTTVRGLLGWAPHWTMLCVAANRGPDTASPSLATQADESLPTAHLDLCLRLDLRLVVVITKLDVANKTTFRQILSSLLSVLKAAGRKPVILPNDQGVLDDAELQQVSSEDAAAVDKVLAALAEDAAVVPILFTSAVKGNGIGKLHALLRRLPIPSRVTEDDHTNVDDDPATLLFHVDDSFNLPPEVSGKGFDGESSDGGSGAIVSGHLQRGSISIGDDVLLGPFSVGTGTGPGAGSTAPSTSASALPSWVPSKTPDDAFLSPRSFGEALVAAMSLPRGQLASHDTEWLPFRVVSTRNLRLPVHTLQEDQAGTVGLLSLSGRPGDLGQSMPEIRKGMILTKLDSDVCAAHSFTASFALDDAGAFVVGNAVAIYCASVRESAKVVAVALETDDNDDGANDHVLGGVSRRRDHAASEDSDAFAFDWDGDDDDDDNDEGVQSDVGPDSKRAARVLVTFRFTAYRAWLERGAKVLVMSTGTVAAAPDRANGNVHGLDGLVGSVVSVFG